MTRGERNNNPMNIRISDQVFQGEVNADTDSAFKQFSDPVMGIRAGAKIILTYFREYGLNTIRGIINRWAPPEENDTPAYINDVAASTGFGDDDVIDLTDPDKLAGLIRAIILHENGEVLYITDQISQADSLALA